MKNGNSASGGLSRGRKSSGIFPAVAPRHEVPESKSGLLAAARLNRRPFRSNRGWDGLVTLLVDPSDIPMHGLAGDEHTYRRQHQNCDEIEREGPGAAAGPFNEEQPDDRAAPH